MGTFRQISVEDAKVMMDKGNVTIIDIRDSESFEAAHIPRAVSISEKNVEEFIKTADKEKPLICYCYHGFSSQGAAGYFTQHGFKEVLSIEGGFEKWRTLYSSIKA